VVGANEIKVWDLPLRLFHWSLSACFAAAWLSVGDRWLDFHIFFGYLLGGLLLFRFWWGWYGEPNALFRDFAYDWRKVQGYLADVLKGRPAHYCGHNPAGGWAIYLMLVMLLLLVITGVMTLGGEERHGPFAGWLGFSSGAALHWVHEILAWSSDTSSLFSFISYLVLTITH
jgi:cytochrome b